MVIAWNLMCRSSNAFGIRHSHMEWKGDALQIYFAHMKIDQGGDRPRDPRPLLTFHHSYLTRALSLKHSVFLTPLFQDAAVLSSLAEPDTCIRPTGVPPHVSILCETKWLKESLVAALTKIEDTVKDIITELEKRAIGAGTVTFDGLNAAITKCLQDCGIDDLVQRLIAPPKILPTQLTQTLSVHLLISGVESSVA
ncbi:hypothetical protein GQ600_19715 [Phytophthora cactorum]|nr:hypothetical protein GQ600_19715 [Phytophthora cactorum]